MVYFIEAGETRYAYDPVGNLIRPSGVLLWWGHVLYGHALFASMTVNCQLSTVIKEFSDFWFLIFTRIITRPRGCSTACLCTNGGFYSDQ